MGKTRLWETWGEQSRHDIRPFPASVEIDKGWAFLRKCLEDVPLAVFSRAAYAPDWLPGKRTVVLPPNIDPFSAKNQFIPEESVRAEAPAAVYTQSPIRRTLSGQ